MKYILSAVFLLLLSAEADSADKKQYEYFSCQYDVAVPLSGPAVKSILSTVRSVNGIVLSYNDSRISFRVPLSKAETVSAAIKHTGFINDEKTERMDVGEYLAVNKARLAVKEEFIAKLYKLTEEADLAGTLNAEKAIEKALEERDALKSEIAKYERMSSYIDYTVNISGPSLYPAEKSKSRWEFVNSMGVENSSGLR